MGHVPALRVRAWKNNIKNSSAMPNTHPSHYKRIVYGAEPSPIIHTSEHKMTYTIFLHLINWRVIMHNLSHYLQ